MVDKVTGECREGYEKRKGDGITSLVKAEWEDEPEQVMKRQIKKGIWWETGCESVCGQAKKKKKEHWKMLS